MTRYGKIKKVVEFDPKSKTAIEKELFIIGIRSQLIILDNGESLRSLSEASPVEWCDDLKNKKIDSIYDLNFEINNIESRKNNPNLRRVNLYKNSSEDKFFNCLVDKDIINHLDAGNKLIKCIDGDEDYYVNFRFIERIQFIDKE